jgi:hypothetical protein
MGCKLLAIYFNIMGFDSWGNESNTLQLEKPFALILASLAITTIISLAIMNILTLCDKNRSPKVKNFKLILVENNDYNFYVWRCIYNHF